MIIMDFFLDFPWKNNIPSIGVAPFQETPISQSTKLFSQQDMGVAQNERLRKWMSWENIKNNQLIE